MTTGHPPSGRTFWFPGIFLALFVLVLFKAFPASGESSCAELLVKRCNTCHYLNRICQKIAKERNKKSWFGRGKGSAGTWKRTIKNMVKQGAQLNKAEEQVLVECLSNPAPELLNLCNIDK